MSGKKNFSKGVEDIFSAKENKKKSRKEETAPSELVKKLQVYVKSDFHQKLKAVSFYSRLSIRDVVLESIQKHLSSLGDDYCKSAMEEYEKSLAQQKGQD